MDSSKNYESPEANVIKFDGGELAYTLDASRDGGHYGGDSTNTPEVPGENDDPYA